jgi:hypothetical protein
MLLISLWETRTLHKMRALTLINEMLRLLPSTVERVGENKSLPVRSKLGDGQNEETREATRPEKID